MAHTGDVGTEIAPEVADDPDLAPGEVVRLTQAEVEVHPGVAGLRRATLDAFRATRSV
jgi:hypothetical protein